MSDDSIKRSDAIRAVSKVDDYGDGIGFEVKSHCLVELELVPSADRPTGKWVGAREFCQHLEEVTGEKYQVTGIGNMIYCNQCWQASRRRSKYCPDCGSYNGGGNNDKG